jgi:hypothetical protein
MGYKDDNYSTKVCGHHPETCTCRDWDTKEEPKTNLEKHLESLPDSQFIRRSAVVTQQERMYSEEEVEFIIKIFNSYWFENNPEHEDNLKDWELSKKLFEQFKKK